MGAAILSVVGTASSAIVIDLLAWATGALLTRVILRVTIWAAVPPLPSLTL